MEFPKNFDDELFDVKAILKTYRKSKQVLISYNDEVEKNRGFHSALFKKDRKVVVNAIMDWVMLKGILLRRSDFKKIFSKIRDIFQKEPEFLYYKPPRKRDIKCKKNEDEPDQKTSRSNSPSGLLYSSYRYRIQKKRSDLKEMNDSTTSCYRYIYFNLVQFFFKVI